MKHSPSKRPVTSSLAHWNYFLALEGDVINLSRYIEFCQDNYKTYSVELARVLMAATQECDVLLKQICADGSEKEHEYRSVIPKIYSNISSQTIDIPRFNLQFSPFLNWGNSQTPNWWTANNKVKHERHNRFELASLENTLNAVSALLLCNIYFHHKEGRLEEVQPVPQLFDATGLMAFVDFTTTGVAPHYQLS